MLDRPWSWLASRILALLDTPPTRALVPTDEGAELRNYFTTRIQTAVAPK